MARSPAVACPSQEILGARRTSLIDIELAVVTPMFGGGATPGAADPLLPVRGAAVRGHLRFWWRACHAHLFADAEALFARESAIWGAPSRDGSAKGPSAIQVEIETPDGGHGHADFSGRSQPRYALFPFQGEPEAGVDPADWAEPPTMGRRGVRFRLRLTATPGLDAARIPDLREAAEIATAAWIVFGGVGARTRRGCGSLWCAEAFQEPACFSFQPRTTPPHPDQAARWVQVGQHVWLPNLVQGAPVASTLKAPVLHQGRALTASSAPGETIEAWREAVRLMEQFSQGPNVGRNPDYGRSRWPEADSAREEWPQLDPNPNHAPAHPARQSYPRADLRLPILLQRLGDDPPVLQGAAPGATRMASPIILKALPLSPTQAVPMMVLLTAPHVWDMAGPGVEMVSAFGKRRLTPGQLQMAGNALTPDAPGLMAPGRTIREAFVAWAELRWGRSAAAL